MRVQDLRIGNKVQDESGFIFDVVSIHDCGTIYCDFEGNEGGVWEFDHNNPCVGIPLTEDILLKCGFESDGLLYEFRIEEYVWIYDVELKSSICVKCEHLHQLQNLYFALTNQELNVKL